MTLSSKHIDVESIVSGIKQSKKYRNIDISEETIRDLVVKETANYKKQKDVIKAVRKKLHRIVGIYLGDPDYTLASIELEVAFQSKNPHLIRETCASILATHISTKERLAILDKFYSKIFKMTGTPEIILDVACGLNPLSFPWMGLPTSTLYYAYDIHQQRVDFLNHYFSLRGLLPLANMQDVLVHFPQEKGDIAFLLKEVPRLEQRQRGCTLPLLKALKVRYIIVSFATTNITNRWDLTSRNQQVFHDIIKGMPWSSTEIMFESELVFCIDKGSSGN